MDTNSSDTMYNGQNLQFTSKLFKGRRIQRIHDNVGCNLNLGPNANRTRAQIACQNCRKRKVYMPGVILCGKLLISYQIRCYSTNFEDACDNCRKTRQTCSFSIVYNGIQVTATLHSTAQAAAESDRYPVYRQASTRQLCLAQISNGAQSAWNTRCSVMPRSKPRLGLSGIDIDMLNRLEKVVKV